MSDDKRSETRPITQELAGLSRRELLRCVGLAGVGAVGVGLAGCKNRPDQDLVELSTAPQIIQAGGTVSGLLTGLLTGAAAAGVTFRLFGLGEVQADATGRFEARVQEVGDYEIQFTGRGFRKRGGMLRLNGNVTLNQMLLEDDAGLTMNFLNQYARATGPNGKEGIVPRTPGATNRWTAPPRIKIYRKLADNTKLVVSDARMSALQAAIGALFGPLTASRLGFPAIQIMPGVPPDNLGAVPAGVMVIAQRKDGLLGTTHTASLSDPFSIAKAITTCGVDSPIEIFHRVLAHALGGYVVSNVFDSILNAQGRATPSAQDLLAATFLYTRSAGNAAPDQDPAGTFINV